MTTAADELQSLAAASYGAWFRAASAWTDAVNDVVRALSHWAYDEVLLDPAFTGDTVVRAERDSTLRAVLAHASTKAPVPDAAITIRPAAVVAGHPLVAAVRITPDEGIEPGVYHGHLVDEQGTVISDPINVTVLSR